MKLRSKTIFLVISMLVLSLVTGSVAPLAAPAEASTATTLNGTTVETRRVGAVRGRGGVELARATSLGAALERQDTATPAGPDAEVYVTAGTMLIQHGSRELFILADTRTAFLTTGIGTNAPSTASVTLSALPRSVAARHLFVPFTDVVRHLGGRLTAARTATIPADDPNTPFSFTGANRRNVVGGEIGTAQAVTGVSMIGRGASFPNTLYGRDFNPGAPVPPAIANAWLVHYHAASEDLSGATTPGAVFGYNRINIDGSTPLSDVPPVAGGDDSGSGVGIDAVRMRLAHFGGTDLISTVPAAVREAFPYIPVAKGGVAVIFNVTDAAGNRIRNLNLTADVIARIYLGQIRNWNDAAIARLNPDVTLTSSAIQVNWRPDASGTGEIFTAYLSAASRVWRETLGDTRHAAGEPLRRLNVDMDQVVTAPAVVNGSMWQAADFNATAATTRAQAGNAEAGGSALRDRVRNNANSIGYVSYGDVIQFVGGVFRIREVTTAPTGPIGIARVQNRAGIFTLPLSEHVYAAGLGHGNMFAHPVNSANPGAYPITGLTWIMVEADPAAPKVAGASVQVPAHTIPALPARAATDAAVIAQLRTNDVVVDFIRWAVVQGFGDQWARNIDMAPLSPAMKRQVDQLLGTIEVYD